MSKSIPFHSIPFHSIPFHSIPFHSIPFHSILFYSILFYSFAWIALSVLNQYDERVSVVYNRHSPAARVSVSYITLPFMRYFLYTNFHELACTCKIFQTHPNTEACYFQTHKHAMSSLHITIL